MTTMENALVFLESWLFLRIFPTSRELSLRDSSTCFLFPNSPLEQLPLITQHLPILGVCVLPFQSLLPASQQLEMFPHVLNDFNE